MKIVIRASILILFILVANNLKGQQELPDRIVEAYKQDGWVYFGGSTFLYREKVNDYGNPKVLSLKIDMTSSDAMLYLYEYDCGNQRMMMIAYKRYQNKPIMEKEHYLFENRREWQYPLKTSLGDSMMSAVCEKFGSSASNHIKPKQKNSASSNVRSTYTYSPILAEPITNSKQIGKVENEEVHILGKPNSNYFKVRSGNTVGYLWKGWLK